MHFITSEIIDIIEGIDSSIAVVVNLLKSHKLSGN